MPAKHLLSKGRKQDKRNERLFRNGPEDIQAIEKKQMWMNGTEDRLNFWKISENWHCLEKASWKRRLRRAKVWTSFHVLQIKSTFWWQRFREKMGWSRTGHPWVHSLHVHHHHHLVQAIITSRLDNFKSPPAVFLLHSCSSAIHSAHRSENQKS